LAGYDISTSLSHLYWIDYLGTKAVVPYAAHGLGVYVALSTMDKWWYPDIQRREGVDVLKKCVNEVEKREWRRLECARAPQVPEIPEPVSFSPLPLPRVLGSAPVPPVHCRSMWACCGSLRLLRLPVSTAARCCLRLLAAACCCALVLLLLHLLAVRPSFPANTPHLAANLLYHHFPLLPPCQLSFRVYLFQYPSSFPHLLSPPPLTSRPHPSLTLAYPKPHPHPCPPANAPR
jgi:hypothetical protein